MLAVLGTLFFLWFLLVIGAIILLPFFRWRRNRCFQVYCILVIAGLLLDRWIGLARNYPLLSALLTVPVLICLFVGWAFDPWLERKNR